MEDVEVIETQFQRAVEHYRATRPDWDKSSPTESDPWPKYVFGPQINCNGTHIISAVSQHINSCAQHLVAAGWRVRQLGEDENTATTEAEGAPSGGVPTLVLTRPPREDEDEAIRLGGVICDGGAFFGVCSEAAQMAEWNLDLRTIDKDVPRFGDPRGVGADPLRPRNQTSLGGYASGGPGSLTHFLFSILLAEEWGTGRRPYKDSLPRTQHALAILVLDIVRGILSQPSLRVADDADDEQPQQAVSSSSRSHPVLQPFEYWRLETFRSNRKGCWTRSARRRVLRMNLLEALLFTGEYAAAADLLSIAGVDALRQTPPQVGKSVEAGSSKQKRATWSSRAETCIDFSDTYVGHSCGWIQNLGMTVLHLVAMSPPVSQAEMQHARRVLDFVDGMHPLGPAVGTGCFLDRREMSGKGFCYGNRLVDVTPIVLAMCFKGRAGGMRDMEVNSEEALSQLANASALLNRYGNSFGPRERPPSPVPVARAPPPKAKSKVAPGISKAAKPATAVKRSLDPVPSTKAKNFNLERITEYHQVGFEDHVDDAGSILGSLPLEVADLKHLHEHVSSDGSRVHVRTGCLEGKVYSTRAAFPGPEPDGDEVELSTAIELSLQGNLPISIGSASLSKLSHFTAYPTPHAIAFCCLTPMDPKLKLEDIDWERVDRCDHCLKDDDDVQTFTCRAVEVLGPPVGGGALDNLGVTATKEYIYLAHCANVTRLPSGWQLEITRKRSPLSDEKIKEIEANKDSDDDDEDGDDDGSSAADRRKRLQRAIDEGVQEWDIAYIDPDGGRHAAHPVLAALQRQINDMDENQIHSQAAKNYMNLRSYGWFPWVKNVDGEERAKLKSKAKVGSFLSSDRRVIPEITCWKCGVPGYWEGNYDDIMYSVERGSTPCCFDFKLSGAYSCAKRTPDGRVTAAYHVGETFDRIVSPFANYSCTSSEEHEANTKLHALIRFFMVALMRVHLALGFRVSSTIDTASASSPHLQCRLNRDVLQEIALFLLPEPFYAARIWNVLDSGMLMTVRKRVKVDGALNPLFAHGGSRNSMGDAHPALVPLSLANPAKNGTSRSDSRQTSQVKAATATKKTKAKVSK